MTHSRAEAVRLISEYGRNSFSWKILSPEISLWFGKDESAVAGYVLAGSTRIVGGAPVTHPLNLRAAAEEFEEDARKAGHAVCYFGAEEWLYEISKNKKTHRSILLGAQPVWHPARWKETISRKPSLTAVMNYALRRGAVVSETAFQTVKNDPEYRRCLDEWLHSRKLPALRFLANPNVLEDACGRRFFSARQNGKLLAFLSLTSVAGRKGWIIEHIFRRGHALKGMSELLTDFAVRTIAEEGSGHATFGFSPLSRRAGISYDTNPLWIKIVFDWLYAKGSCFYNFNGLDAFKSKFMPHRWESVYAITNESRFRPATLYHVASAFCSSPPLAFGMLALGKLLS